jgi:hypothetical protein
MSAISSPAQGVCRPVTRQYPASHRRHPRMRPPPLRSRRCASTRFTRCPPKCARRGLITPGSSTAKDSTPWLGTAGSGGGAGGQADERAIRLDGYHWQLGHWGTKWEPVRSDADHSHQGHDLDSGQADYAIATAWSPPLLLFNKVSRDFPTLQFKLEYLEPANDCTGHARWQGGERLEEVEPPVTVEDLVRWGFTEDDAREMVANA